MSSDSTTTVVATPICPACRAELPLAAKYCWLCGNSVQPYSPEKPGATPSLPRPHHQSVAVLWALVVVALFGLVQLSVTAPVVLHDPLFLTTAIAFVAIAITIVALLARSARREGRPWQPEKTAAISILGVVTAIGAAVIATLAIIIALVIAFIVTCGAAGRLPT